MVTIALAILAGLILGSFLNVCIYRLPRDLSVASPSRSFCPVCLEKRLTELNITEKDFDNPNFKIPRDAYRGSMIAWYDNIPLFSFLTLGGRCRNCCQRIPWRYPIVELATAAAFAVCVIQLGATLAAAKFAILAAILITLIATDLEERILPDEFTLGGTLIGLLFAPVVLLEPNFISALLSLVLPNRLGPELESLAEAVFGAAVGSGSIWLVAFLYEKVRHREGLGLGDVKMIAMIGAFMGLQYALETLIVASVLGALIGLIFIFATKKDSATYELPFGTFLGATALILVMLGEVFKRHATN